MRNVHSFWSHADKRLRHKAVNLKNKPSRVTSKANDWVLCRAATQRRRQKTARRKLNARPTTFCLSRNRIDPPKGADKIQPLKSDNRPPNLSVLRWRGCAHQCRVLLVPIMFLGRPRLCVATRAQTSRLSRSPASNDTTRLHAISPISARSMLNKWSSLPYRCSKRAFHGWRLMRLSELFWW